MRRHARLAVLALALPGAAHADPLDGCIAESELGQRMLLTRHFVEAGPHLQACAAVACPVAVARDCVERLQQADASAATVVVSAPDAQVFVDDEPAPAGGAAIRLDPGPHRFRFDRRDGAHALTVVTIEEGARLQRVVASFPGPVEPRSRLQLARVAGGVGLAAVATGAVFGELANSRHHREQADCPSAASCPDPAGAQRAYESATTYGTTSTVAVAVGGGLLATGLVLWLAQRARRPPVLALAPTTTGLAVRGAF